MTFSPHDPPLSRTHAVLVAAACFFLSGCVLLLSPLHASAATIGKPGNYISMNVGLIGWWTLDGNDIDWASGTVVNRGSQGFPGYLIKMSTTTSPVIGKIGQALDFEADDDYVLSSATFSGSYFSYSFWLKTDSASNSILGWGGFRFCGFSSGELRCTVDGDSTGAVGTSYTPYLGTWTHVAFVSTTSGQALYVNGAQVSIASETLNTGAGAVQLGVRISSSFDMNGSLDDVRIYDRDISAAEVRALYAAGAAKVAASAPQGEALSRGLIGHWTFDGPDMTPNVRDRSGQGNHGNLIGQTSTTTLFGKIGQALNFDGVNDSVQVPAFSVGSVSFTMSAWVKRGTGGDIIEQPVTEAFHFAVGNKISVYAQGWWTFNTDIPSNEWTFVTVTYDGSDLGAYVNGVFDSETAKTFDISSNNTTLYIGNAQGNPDPFDGLIDDVRIYNRALSAAEVRQLYESGSSKVAASAPQGGALSQGLVGHWTMDGKDVNWSSGAVTDRSGNGNTGYAVNMSTTTSPAIGRIGQALSFDGADDVISVSNESNFDFDQNSPFTISAWVMSLGGDNSDTIVSKHQNSGNFPGYNFGIDAANLRLVFTMIGTTGGCGTDCINDATGINSISPRIWNHVVVTVDGSGTSEGTYFYMDGTLSADSGSSDLSSSPLNDAPITMGRNLAAGGTELNARIDDVRIYNRVLSATEIRQLYNQGR